MFWKEGKTQENQHLYYRNWKLRKVCAEFTKRVFSKQSRPGSSNLWIGNTMFSTILSLINKRIQKWIQQEAQEQFCQHLRNQQLGRQAGGGGLEMEREHGASLSMEISHVTTGGQTATWWEQEWRVSENE